MPSEVYGDRYHPRTTSSWGSVFNLGNSAIGAGVLSFPMAYKSLGYGGGILCCIIMAFITGGTNMILCAYADKYKATSYQTLVRKAIGKNLSTLTSFIIFIYITGSCVAYLIIVGDTFSPLVGAYVFGPNSIWADRRVVIVVSSVILVLPFILQRHLGALAGVSTLAVLVMTYTAIVVVSYFIKAEVEGPSLPYDEKSALDQGDLQMFKFDYQSLDALPIIVFAYQCHAQAVPIFYEINWTSKLFNVTPIMRLFHCAVPREDDEESMVPLMIDEEQEDEVSELPGHHNRDIHNNTQGLSNGNDNSNNNTDNDKPGKSEISFMGGENRSKSQMIDNYISTPLDHNQVELTSQSNYHLKRFGLVFANNIRLNDKIKCMNKVIIAAFIEMSILYNLVGVTGYLLFGANVKSNVINNFAENDGLIQFTRALIGIAVIFHYPINIFVSRSAFDSLRKTIVCQDPEEFMPYDRLFQNTIFLYLTTLLIAVLVKDLGIVFKILGGTSATLIVFIMPGLILILDVLRYRKHGRIFGYKDSDVVTLNLKPQENGEQSDEHLMVRLDVLKDEIDEQQETQDPVIIKKSTFDLFKRNKNRTQYKKAKPLQQSKKNFYVRMLQLLVGSSLILLGVVISTVTIMTIIYSSDAKK